MQGDAMKFLSLILGQRLGAIVSLSAVLLALNSHAVPAEQVTVTVMRESCDYFIIKAEAGFCIFEWYGGCRPKEGDVLRGDLDSYGFQSAYDDTQKAEITAYVEEYWLEWDEAVEKLDELCH
jgi:hypothetical protein